MINKLLYSSIKYLKITEAGIRSDMAARIMHSTLPAVVDKSQVVSTNGAIDHSALLEAIKGSKNIIKYGLRACFGELHHYKMRLDPEYKDTSYGISHMINDIMFEKDPIQQIDMIIEKFNKPYWDTNFGGQKWLTIAKSLKRIIYLDNLVSYGDRSKKYDNARELLLELNVFDGLTHNTDSIMRNLIELEVNEINNHIRFNNRKLNEFEQKPIVNFYNEYGKVQKLMDTKEIENPLKVFKKIEPELDNPIAYKEYINKFRNDPKYYEKDHDDELHWIDFNKYKQSTINSLNDSLATISVDDLNYLYEDTLHSKREVMDLYNRVSSYNLESSDYKEKFGHIIRNLKLFASDLVGLSDSIPEDDKSAFEKFYKSYKSLLNNIIYYLQAI